MTALNKNQLQRALLQISEASSEQELSQRLHAMMTQFVMINQCKNTASNQDILQISAELLAKLMGSITTSDAAIASYQATVEFVCSLVELGVGDEAAIDLYASLLISAANGLFKDGVVLGKDDDTASGDKLITSSLEIAAKEIAAKDTCAPIRLLHPSPQSTVKTITAVEGASISGIHETKRLLPLFFLFFFQIYFLYAKR
jgi:hypothetical protein